MDTWRYGPHSDDTATARGAGSPDPGPPRRRFLFSRRVVLLTVATVLLAAVLAGTALAVMAAPRRTTAELRDEIAPVVEQLYLAADNSRRAQERFEASLATSGVERSTNISESQRLGNLTATHFSTYREMAIGTPAEQRLIRQYDTLTRASQAAGATAFGLADSPDFAAREAAFREQSDLAAQASQTLADIQRRFYVSLLVANVATANEGLDDARLWVYVATAVVTLVVVLGGVFLFRSARRDERVLGSQEAERRREERRAGLENQLQRGLEMEPTEDSTYAVIQAALTMVRQSQPVELLLADSSRAHFHQAFSTDPDGGPGCPVSSPTGCPAAASGQTRVFFSSERLDACPYLRNRTEVPSSATCVPVNIAGNTTGVFHTTGPENVVPDPNELAELELVARKAGERIGYLRVLARSEMQARADSLTGLVNRRSLDDHARGLVERGDPFVVAFADLDHFKDLNDTYGHEAGDRALRLFGRVLRDSVRPADVPARYGGEEFVVLFPDLAIPDARLVADRIRERLRTAVAGATVPPFTVSVGLASWEPPEEFADTVARADRAMLYAKGGGRDLVITSAEVPGALVPLEPRAATTEPDAVAGTDR